MPLKEHNMEMVLEAGSVIETFDRNVRVSSVLKPQL